MSTTYSTGRRISAARTATGIVYAMFEETYESNVFPQHPKWHCVGIGRLEATLKAIFDRSSSCEGGMVKTRHGAITPEGYVASWLSELANPHAMRADTTVLESGEGWRCCFPTKDLAEACTNLVAAWWIDEAAALERDGRLTLRLPADAALASALVEACGCNPWRVMGPGIAPEEHDPRDPSLGHAPAKSARWTMPVVDAMFAHGDTMVMRAPDGAWRLAGPAYHLVGSYVAGLWREEATEPGHHTAKARAYRKAIAGSPRIADGTRVLVDPGLATEEKWWIAEGIERLRGSEGITAPAGEPFEVMVTGENGYEVCGLGECCTWLVRDARPAVARQEALAL